MVLLPCKCIFNQLLVKNTMLTATATEAENITPEAYAKEAGLRYVSDHSPGIKRLKTQEGTFSYQKSNGETITDEKTLERIKLLRIPPAWENVWICSTTTGHIQATGIDSRGRKQYRYHEKWHSARNSTKFDKMLKLGAALPQLRQQIQQDLRRQGFPREKIIATVVSLLDTTYIRVGNRYYAQTNKSYGLTTLRNKHVKLEGNDIKICFIGKKSIAHEVQLTDRKLIKIVKQCRELPGYELFQYLDEEGHRHPVNSEDVNSYLRENTGIDLTAKDFRTWGGSTLTIHKLLAEPKPESEKEVKKQVNDAVKFVAVKLGNTPTVCRKYYIHPLVLKSYESGQLAEEVSELGELPEGGLQREEVIFVRLLQAAAETEA